MTRPAIRLGDLRNSFEGVIPSIIGTIDDDGMPNISYLSHVYYIDETHVALSNQFFSKTAANVRRLGVATVMVVDALSGAQHLLDLQFEQSCDSGEVFERISTHLDVMSHLRGHEGLMKLKSADIYRVTQIREVLAAAPLTPAPEPRPRCDRIGHAARIISAISHEADSDTILDTALDGLRDEMAFRYLMVLLPNEDETILTMVASRGYDRYGTGAEVSVGTGVIGMTAASKRPVLIADLTRARRYARAVTGDSAQIPLPGLEAPQCQMAVPMLAKGRLRGVIFVESELSFAFTHEDEAALSLIANHLASCLLLAELQAQTIQPSANLASATHTDSRRFRFRYFMHDDSVFIDNDYLIRGVPGRLLYYFVRKFSESGQRDFSNREIRRDTSLRLPDFKDNLETRLILLRRRLDEKAGPLRLCRPERGQVRLEFDGLPDIEVVGAAPALS
ncbi:MAG: GAF domain-containing protein [Asticcacaulis sp.]|nr:GAF domain-containing protein [Asticcacaulis sp.]